jgi:hypothetical protein
MQKNRCCYNAMNNRHTAKMVGELAFDLLSQLFMGQFALLVDYSLPNFGIA